MQWSGGLRLSPSSTFVRWVISHHSSSKLFVEGLSYDTNESVLNDAFGKHGEIIQVKVICDHVTGKSKGYGFVQFNSETAATAALMQMDGQDLEYLLQETSRDGFCFFVTSTPISKLDVNIALLVGSSGLVLVQPSGFALMPDGPDGFNSNASLVTIAIQQ